MSNVPYRRGAVCERCGSTEDLEPLGVKPESGIALMIPQALYDAIPKICARCAVRERLTRQAYRTFLESPERQAYQENAIRAEASSEAGERVDWRAINDLHRETIKQAAEWLQRLESDPAFSSNRSARLLEALANEAKRTQDIARARGVMDFRPGLSWQCTRCGATSAIDALTVDRSTGRPVHRGKCPAPQDAVPVEKSEPLLDDEPDLLTRFLSQIGSGCWECQQYLDWVVRTKPHRPGAKVGWTDVAATAGLPKGTLEARRQKHKSAVRHTWPRPMIVWKALPTIRAFLQAKG